ncbi:MAG: CDP-alcohol phosphatidyltransferase family protein, partial [Spirochaetales bacterium]
MFDAVLRKSKDQILAPVAGMLSGRVSAMSLTLAGLVLGLAAAGSLALGLNTLALLLWLANRTVDGLDGTVARLDGSQCDLGGYVDMISDVVVYAALGLAIPVGGGVGQWTAAALMLGAFYVNITSWTILAPMLETRRLSDPEARSTSVHMQRGFMEGSETILAYAVLIAIPQWRFVVMLVAASAACISAV